ncbi:hypothetical protein QR680_006003 [Steinernema hermaphroditum]|uniref:Uncharacterized protein n=1 Tax=Steinernema hermaphroditum TaxID=289476 RepID=A0AA39HWD1_9BILA|nr:hypothetical protein QR680_006003 [Steinernema hermaphroditum]
MDYRISHFRFVNIVNQLAAILGLLMCFVFFEFADFQRVFTGGPLQVHSFVRNHELLVFTGALLVNLLASAMMHYVSDPRANTSNFCYYLLFSIASCLLSFFSIAHIWTLIQILHGQLGVEERATELRFVYWYLYRLFVLGASFCICCSSSLFSLLMYRVVKEIVHDSRKAPNFRYITISNA